MRRLAISALTSVLLLAGAAAPPADAQGTPYTEWEICGPGFSVIDSVSISTPSLILGRAYLMWNPATGQNCATTIKYNGTNRRTHAGVVLQKRGGPRKSQSGNFRYYAGPLYVHAPGTCVQWGGGITVGKQSAGFMSGWGHCG